MQSVWLWSFDLGAYAGYRAVTQSAVDFNCSAFGGAGGASWRAPQGLLRGFDLKDGDLERRIAPTLHACCTLCSSVPSPGTRALTKPATASRAITNPRQQRPVKSAGWLCRCRVAAGWPSKGPRPTLRFTPVATQRWDPLPLIGYGLELSGGTRQTPLAGLDSNATVTPGALEVRQVFDTATLSASLVFITANSSLVTVAIQNMAATAESFRLVVEGTARGITQSTASGVDFVLPSSAKALRCFGNHPCAGLLTRGATPAPCPQCLMVCEGG